MCDDRQVGPEFLVLGESYTSAKQVKVDTRDGLDIFFGVIDFDVNQKVFGIVRVLYASIVDIALIGYCVLRKLTTALLLVDGNLLKYSMASRRRHTLCTLVRTARTTLARRRQPR